MIGKLLKARHLMMFQMTSSFQPVVSRRERSQPPRKSMSNNCERSFPLHLITLIHIVTTRKVYACFARYFKKYCSQCHSIYPDNRITRVLCSQNLSSISWVISVGIAGRSSAQGGQTQLGPTMFNVYGTFLSHFQLNRSWLTQKPCQLDPIGKLCLHWGRASGLEEIQNKQAGKNQKLSLCRCIEHDGFELPCFVYQTVWVL